MLIDFYKYKELLEQKHDEIERLKAEYCCILTQCGEELRAISQVTNFDNLKDILDECRYRRTPNLSELTQCKLNIEMSMFLGRDVPFEFESIEHTFVDRYDIRFKLKNGNEYELWIPEFKKFRGWTFDTAQYCFVRVDKDGDYAAFVTIARSFEFNDITAAIREELKQKKGKKK